jgi:hypothetical protein
MRSCCAAGGHFCCPEREDEVSDGKQTRAQTLVGVRLPPDVLQRLKAEARADDRPLSVMAKRLIVQGLEQMPARSGSPATREPA